MKYLKPRTLKKLIKRRIKEDIYCIPINNGIMFYNPKNRIRKDIFVRC